MDLDTHNIITPLTEAEEGVGRARRARKQVNYAELEAGDVDAMAEEEEDAAAKAAKEAADKRRSGGAGGRRGRRGGQQRQEQQQDEEWAEEKESEAAEERRGAATQAGQTASETHGELGAQQSKAGLTVEQSDSDKQGEAPCSSSSRRRSSINKGTLTTKSRTCKTAPVHRWNQNPQTKSN